MSRAAFALAAALALPATGCATAVKHPAITAGVVGAAFGLGTCKLASDDVGTCLAVGGGAGLGLALVTAAALWLGGDGNTAPVEDQAQPLPEDGHPVHRHHRAPPAPAPDAATPAEPVTPPPAPATPPPPP